MKPAAIGVVLAGLLLLPVQCARALKGNRSRVKPKDQSLSAALDWMAHTYKFTEAEIHSDEISVYKREIDASLSRQGCRLTIREQETSFDSSISMRQETSQSRTVIDLRRVDPKSIQLQHAANRETDAYYVLAFATIGGFKNIELYFADEAQPAIFSHGIILLLPNPSDYATRFAATFRRATKLCAEKGQEPQSHEMH